jgi:polysaccharide biosynthesis/export protein
MHKVCKIDGICRAAFPRAMKQYFLEQRTRIAATCLVFCLFLPALAQESQQTPTPPPANPPSTNQPQPAQPGQPKPAAPAAGAPVDSNSYKVGPSDVLLIRVWGEPEFSGAVAVQQNGNFTLPLVGDLPAGGKTPIEIQGIIAKALTKYVVKPLVTVTVQEVGSKKYYMDGYIAHPGEYALVTPISILEAISKAGGTQEFANTKRIYILRGDKRIYFNLKDVLHGKHMEQNIPLEPGDHIVVP